MQQHPVPQNIASYEFRLVGDMTLKQFLQVAGGGLVALLFYAAPLPAIIKWPFIFLSAVSGAALAFLPFEERPLSAWFVAFIRAIYSPTKYAYQEGRVVDVFAPETGGEAAGVPAPAGGEVYLSTPGTPDSQEIKKFEEEEQNFFGKALSLFHLTKDVPTPTAPIAQTAPAAPQVVAPAPRMVVEEVRETAIPQNMPVSIPTSAGPTYEAAPAAQAQPLEYSPQAGPVFTPAPRRGPGRPRLTAPKYEISATPPSAPRTPNIIVGQILDSLGNTVEAAILEIKDSDGRPVRALRSNKVGHFLTATPLLPGSYEVLIEKDGFVFDPVQVSINNEIIPPIEIRAKSPNQ